MAPVAPLPIFPPPPPPPPVVAAVLVEAMTETLDPPSPPPPADMLNVFPPAPKIFEAVTGLDDMTILYLYILINLIVILIIYFNIFHISNNIKLYNIIIYYY